MTFVDVEVYIKIDKRNKNIEKIIISEMGSTIRDNSEWIT
jgi:hypothetical protein